MTVLRDTIAMTGARALGLRSPIYTNFKEGAHGTARSASRVAFCAVRVLVLPCGSQHLPREVQTLSTDPRPLQFEINKRSHKPIAEGTSPQCLGTLSWLPGRAGPGAASENPL